MAMFNSYVKLPEGTNLRYPTPQKKLSCLVDNPIDNPIPTDYSGLVCTHPVGSPSY